MSGPRRRDRLSRWHLAAVALTTAGDTVSVALSTLVAFALIQPVRRRAQKTVTRVSR